MLHKHVQRLRLPGVGHAVVIPRRARVRCAGAGAGPGQGNSGRPEDMGWLLDAFPSYLQSANHHNPDVCRDFDQAVTRAERGLAATPHGEATAADNDTPAVWYAIRREAERDAATEPLLSSFLYASILAHDSFERALAFVLANRLANAVMLPTQLFEIFHEVLVSEPEVREGALADVEACRERDPASTSYSQALLYYKGYHAIQTHRIAHALWNRGQKVMAVALQSRMSEVLAVDIHPAARIGKGILLDHGTGVVIGETAVIGNNVSLLQNVTLGGTGKEVGDRHPKISDNVLIGACATVLGNITVGRGAQIAAGSLVLKPVPAHTMVAGSPAKEVGKVAGNPASRMQQWASLQDFDPFYGRLEAQPAAETRSGSTSDGTASNPDSSSSSRRRTEQDTAAELEAQLMATSSVDLPEPPQPHVNGVLYKHAQEHHMQPGGGAAAAGLPGGHAAKQPPAAAESATARPSSQKHKRSAASPDPVAEPSLSGHASSEAIGSSRQSMTATGSSSSSGGGSHNPRPLPVTGSVDGEQAYHDPPRRLATVGGVYEGSVEATVDEEDAAVKWANVKEDPEYVI